MPDTINLQSTLRTFYTANKSKSTVIADASKDGGVSSVKNWKLNLLSKFGSGNVQSGNVAGTPAQGVAGHEAGASATAGNSAMETLYTAIEQALKPQMGESAELAKEQARETFKCQGDVTPEKFESFSKALQHTNEHRTEQRRTNLKDLSDGKLDEKFKTAEPGTVDTLLRMLTGEKVGHLGVDVVFLHHEAGHFVSDYEKDVLARNEALFDLCADSLQYFKDNETALNYQISQLDPNDPDFTDRAEALTTRLKGVVSDRADFIQQMGTKLGTLPEARFERTVEEAVENPNVVKFTPQHEPETYVHSGTHMAGTPIQRTAESEHKSDDVRFDSTVKLHVDEEPDGIDRTSAKKNYGGPVEHLMQEVGFALDIAYRTEDDSFEGDGTTEKRYMGGRAATEGLNQVMRLKTPVKIRVTSAEFAAMKGVKEHPGFKNVDAFMAKAEATMKEYKEALDTFPPEFREACETMDAATKALEEAQTKGRTLRSNVKHHENRAHLKTEVNEGGVKVVKASEAVMKAEDTLEELKETADPTHVALRERYEDVSSQYEAAKLVQQAQQELDKFIETAKVKD